MHNMSPDRPCCAAANHATVFSAPTAPPRAISASRSRAAVAATLWLAATASGTAQAAGISSFEGLASGPGQFFIGTPQPFPGAASSFQSGFVTYGHHAVDWGGGFTAWSGFAWSNVNDPGTPGFGNQYAARAGAGALGTATYAVGFLPAVFGGGGQTERRTIQFDLPSLLTGAWFTNTTYSALSMLEGDAFTRPFASATGDFLELTIEGLSAGVVTGSLTFALADFRGPTPFVLNDWRFVDLSALGFVDGLGFRLNGSDFGPFGLNTPAYFAMDELSRQAVVPLPGAVWGFLAGLGVLGRCLRTRQTLA